MAQAKEEKAAATQTSEASDFSSLLQKEFKPKSDRAREEVETAVRTLAAQVLEAQDLIADDAINSINAIVAEPATRARLVGLGLRPLSMTSAQFGELIANDTEKWAKVIRSADIKIE